MRRRKGISNRGPGIWSVLGWALLVAMGIGLLWIGFAQPFSKTKEDQQSSIEQKPGATSTLTPTLAAPSATPVLPAARPTTPAPTATLPPTNTPEPTAIPPTPTTPAAKIVVGADGVNVRSGPGLNYTILTRLDPGVEAQITGRYSDWWQIQHAGGVGWVYDGVVTASNTEGVPQVEPPPAPTAAATAVPPTATPAPPTVAPANYRGLVPDSYQVEGAPGPYGIGADIWFNIWITNKSGTAVEFQALGTLVEETGQFQQSWTYSNIQPNKQLVWRDHINIPQAGTYKLWMTVCFLDGECNKMMGPITVNVQ
jgi:hypothetical protein